ncbi:MAG: 2-C-methyl-D-erythritol 2,4-cyclodiphosphate synthase [Bacteroidetes bacterium]|nr:2-C-methyl-D-erythritol 2,4-cyclodiphosphate synthase [Bacteroidota bacterium]
MTSNLMRIGFGFDTHKLEPGKLFILGGVPVEHSKGSAGHSDADVLIHAIIDSLLGAAGLPDIGQQFPDTSAEYKGIDSSILLKKTLELTRDAGYGIGNIDCTVVLQTPKISAVIPSIVKSLSGTLEISPGQINVKAKTSEKLGFIGREEGVSAYAVALLVNSEQ